jgi:hypothetical protein
MAADCKSAALTCYGGSNPSLPTILRSAKDGGATAFRGRWPASMISGNPRAGFPNSSAAGGNTVHGAHVAQLVEHVLGKDGVSSSNLLVGSNMPQGNPVAGFPRTPSAPLIHHNRGSNSVVESQPSKLLVAGSSPVSRSMDSNERRTCSVRAEGFGEPGVGFPEINVCRRVRAKRLARSKNAGPVLPVSRSNDTNTTSRNGEGICREN